MLFSWLDRWRNYRFEDEWVVEAPVEKVWDSIVNVEDWPIWWQGLEFSYSADKLPLGMQGKRYTTGWKSPLRYRLEINAVIRESSSHALIIADIHGDIEGVCTCRIQESRTGTRSCFSLAVRTNTTWMSLFSPFLKGCFTRNHNRIMAKGMHGFSLHLARMAAAA
ncbi:MAG: hypothetical protein FP813_07500 [Desulfurivibrio sp.]|nr:hypothetical protein [Desulfurivibrio sp.]MBU4119209.1 hypothetical protein [Pseudomonadota bacterium]